MQASSTKNIDKWLGCIFNEDCRVTLARLPDECVDAVVTDPPFGINFEYNDQYQDSKNADEYWQWLSPIYREITRVTRRGGLIAIWQTQVYFKHFWEWFGDDIHIYAACKNFVQLRKVAINYSYDPIVMLYKSGAPFLHPSKPKRSVDFFVANMAKYVTQTTSIARQHPCPRPIDQVREIIDNFVVDRGIVYDPFLGSGTTAVACTQTGRKWFGSEVSAKYCAVANARLSAQPTLWVQGTACKIISGDAS